jgi:methionine sulfoxide reductase heme-binding subunit
MEHHLFWITSRAAGTAALLLASAAVCVGLVMGGRLLRSRRPDLRALHEALSLATTAALVVHGVSLLGDRFLHPSVADISVPFASGYKEPWMAAGIVGGWMLILLRLSYCARGRIGPARWRQLHRFTALAWILGVVHTVGEGTDARQTWFLVAAGALAIPAATLLAVRHSTGRPARSRADVRRPAPAPTE